MCKWQQPATKLSSTHSRDASLVAAYIYKLNKTAPSASGCSSETLRVASFPALVVIRCRRPAMTQVIVLDESEQRSAYPPLRRASTRDASNVSAADCNYTLFHFQLPCFSCQLEAPWSNAQLMFCHFVYVTDGFSLSASSVASEHFSPLRSVVGSISS